MAKVFLTTPPWQPFHTLQGLFPEIPPLGLQIVAGALRAAGHEARVFSAQHLRPMHPDLLRAVGEFSPDIIGFSNSELPNAPMVLKVAGELKRRLPAVKFFVGGQAPTFSPDIFLAPGSPFDAVSMYEAENTVAPIVDALVSGSPLEGLKGCAWRGPGGELRVAPPGEPPASLDESPLPFREGSLYRARFTDGLYAAVETSRGCPYQCSFCSIPGYYGAPRYKSASRIIAELRELKRMGVTEFSINDDSFGTRPDIVREVLEAMLRDNMGFRFGVQIRADIIAAEPWIIELGARAGLHIAVVGFEGYTSTVQDEARKGNSADINREASRVLRRNGVAVYGTHVFGGPGTSMRDNLATFFHGRMNSDVFRMTIYTPLPGSRLHEELSASGKLAECRPEDFYEGKYLIKDAHNPLLVQLAYFALLALHYALPDTLLKLFHRHETIREFNRRAYRGAFHFVLGKLLPFLYREAA
jgi:radical SAM superfamily enzyme YgiQ (UPF0313 family)